jgi:hypothetical protein
MIEAIIAQIWIEPLPWTSIDFARECLEQTDADLCA